MQRFSITPRPRWRELCQEVGFIYLDHEGGIPYWNEAAYYEFSSTEIDILDDASQELWRICLEGVEYVVQNQLYERLQIPSFYAEYISQSWRNRAPTLYGRFDLAYDGRNPPKLLEFNADTPTSLLETAVVQWQWLEQTFSSYDQFNSVHERLIETWQHLAPQLNKAPIYFCSMPNDEDFMTVEYLRDTASQAGLTTVFLEMSEIGWNGQHFVDLTEQPIKNLFKLYPWEWMFEEEFGQHVVTAKTNFIEPAWKAILSNKLFLEVLWELNPNHPNLLAASRQPLNVTKQVKKPVLGREGANISIIENGAVTDSTRGIYHEHSQFGKAGFVYQEFIELPQFDGNYTVIGSWIINQHTAGIGVRESNHPIIGNQARFVPHFFL